MVVALAGDDLKRALEEEQWRETWRIGELSAIEFRTLAMHWVKTFARDEKLKQEATNKLVAITKEQWDRIAEEAKSAK